MTGLRWSRRSTTRIAEALLLLGISVSPNTIARLLHQMGYSLRVNHKQISTTSSPNRNLQFEYLTELRGRFQRCHLPISRRILILADTGGSNGYRCYAWKTELQSQLANSFALSVTVAHYPPGASKWNPIEHRLFSEVSRNWAGEPLDSYQKILNYTRTTKTQTGLTVTAYLDRRNYPCGLKPTPDQLASLRLQRHETLPEWNYTIKPQL